MTRPRVSLFILVIALTASLPLAGQAPSPPATEHREAVFRIFVRGVPFGNETITVDATPTEWKITSTGVFGGPLQFQLNSAVIRYDRAWHPLGFTMDARVKDKPLRVSTTVAGGKAISQVIQDDKSQPVTHDVTETSILLPNNMYGAYEAVVARFATMKEGDTVRAYVAPQAEITLSLDAVSTEQVKTTARTFQSRHYRGTAQNPGGPLKFEVWADDQQRLMRFLVPHISLDVMRDDIAAVSTRQQTIFRPNDEDVFVLANGFNLAATISKPAPATPAAPPPAKGQKAPKEKPVRLPAIVLVAGSGPVNRDENAFGIPIFAQLANALADAGYLVIRYDKRGVGQSGGRIESATLTDYAEDVRAVVRFLSKRKDVDDRRIAVVGHSEGAAVALLAARQEDKIRALVSIAGPGTKGADLILEQQQHALENMKLSDEERRAKVDLQKKIQAAAISGQGWDAIPPELRRQADSPWFSSLLQYDPAKAMEKVKQPILILQGDLDRQVPAHHAEKLVALAKARKKAPDVQVEHYPTLNHLLVPAKTGEVSEYTTLESKTISADVSARIAEWLKATMTPKT
jgi:uncharacterized protein